MKRLLTIFLPIFLLFSLCAPASALEAEETQPTRPENACGEQLTWHYSDGTLTISGSGDMDDCSDGAPWDAYADSIHTLVLSGSVTSIGPAAFSGFTGLTDIDFGSSLREIGENAFRGCTGLTSISLPATFRLFGPSAFQDCAGLTEVHCAGGMPSFRSNCLWNGKHITIYCPDSNIWAASYVGELETNFGGRLEVLTESGKDVYVWPEEATEATEPAAQPTTLPTTQPTESPTVPATTVPQTEPLPQATEPPVEVTETTVPETTAPQLQPPAQKPLNGILIGVFILSGTLSLLLIGLLIFKGSHRGGKYGR